MRQDIYKVIVERPRRGGKSGREAPPPMDLEDSPRQEGLRRRHRNRKWLNENLRPLERYLAAQVGRPWNKVYSEICACIDRRDTVQRHVHQHLDDYVKTDVVADGDVILAMNGRFGYAPVGDLIWLRFYVDPRTGLLCLNKRGAERKRAIKLKRGIDLLMRLNPRIGTRITIDDSTQLHLIDGVWYRVTLAPVAKGRAIDAIDRLRGIAAHLCPDVMDAGATPSNLSLFGRTGVYAAGKRQLPARELRAHRLVNTVR